MSNNCQKDCGLYDQYVIYNKALEYAMKLESNAVKSSEEEAILGHQINDTNRDCTPVSSIRDEAENYGLLIF